MLDSLSYHEVNGKDDKRISMATDLKQNHYEVCWVTPSLCEKVNITSQMLVDEGSIDTKYQDMTHFEYYVASSFKGKSGTSLKNLQHLA